MPVEIDEISVVASAAGENTPAPASATHEPTPEFDLRRQRDLLARLEARTARVTAD